LDALGRPVAFDPTNGNLFIQNPATGQFPPGTIPLNALAVTPTPGNTLGTDRTELGNMTFIFKALAYECRNYAVSGGLGVTIPTGQDVDVRVNDFLGPIGFNFLTVQRIRDFHVTNETWGLSPFLAALVAPTDRLFAQGFVQVDIPVNSSRASVSEFLPINQEAQVPNGNFLTPQFAFQKLPPFYASVPINDQTLLQMDFGIGYWVLRDPKACWLTGIIPTAEVHYTNTLDNANIVVLPTDPSRFRSSGGFDFIPPPRVGNLRNRMDILDVTLGTTFQFGQKSSLATAVAFPLKGTDNRTFDWEFTLQFNYYFGGPRNRTPNYQ
jgi:hypothetical protein